jgi:cobalamin biosynthesis protein CobT
MTKRIQGSISYYRGSKKELMPEVTRDEVVRVPMSSYQQMHYQSVRADEVNQELKNKKFEVGKKQISAKAAPVVTSIYGTPPTKQSSSYRVFSRQGCNFSYPENIVRPLPMNKNEIIQEAGKDIDIPETAVEEAPSVEGESDILAALAEAAEEGEEEGEGEEEEGDEEIDASERADIAAELRAEGKEEEAEAELTEDAADAATAIALEIAENTKTSSAASAAMAAAEGGGGPDGPNATAAPALAGNFLVA